MNCTRCKNGNLLPSVIDGQFSARTCSGCGGNWILIEDYVCWKERNTDYTFDEHGTFDLPDATDSKQALICPVSGTIMRKFRISATSEYKIDYSSVVGGLWLDKGEWEALKRAGLGGCLNALVTENWQKKVKEDTAKHNFSDIYEAKFGNEAYSKIKELRAWLQAHEHQLDLRAYLLAEDPYSAEK